MRSRGGFVDSASMERGVLGFGTFLFAFGEWGW